MYESAFNVQNATGWSLLLGEAWAALKTILRFDSAELYLALNKDVSDEVVQSYKPSWTRCAAKALSRTR